jgi:Flp pilus assembly protein TadD
MRRAAVLIGLLVAVVAVYGRTAGFGFTEIDDPAYVSENPAVLGGLSGSGVAWAFTTTREANWHPLTWLSLMADASIGGPRPRVFHVTNVVLHALCAVLLFTLFERMTGAVWRSALVAALFAVHPIHVESVAWVAERKDVLSTAFGLLALLAWLAFVRRPAAVRAFLALSLYAASLMAKPMLVSLPLLMLLLDVWPLARTENRKRLVVEKLPWLALAAASCVVTFLVQTRGGAARSLTHYPLSGRAANALASYVAYLAKALWPQRLAAFYPYDYGGVLTWEVAGSALVLAAVTWACVRLRRRAPYLLVGWLWYLISLVPVIGLVQVGAQAMADRYTYVPLIGPFVMLAWGAGDVVARAGRERQRSSRIIAAGVAGTVLAALAVVAARQAATWRDSVALYTHALSVTEGNAVAHGGLATALFHRGEIDRAVAECRAALRIAPDMGDVQSNLIRGLIAQGNIDEAEARTREALASRPGDARVHVNAGLVAMIRGSLDAAAAAFDRALQLDPNDQDAHLNMGAILLRTGKRDEAVAHFVEAVRLRPGDAKARRALDRVRGVRQE